MISCVSLNPSIDRTLVVEHLTIGGLNRVCGQTDVAAGKGVNVALAAAALGEECTCTGLMYREGSALFEKRLSEGGVRSDFVLGGGAVRVNVKVFDQARKEITELNAQGTPATADQLEQVRNRVRVHARNSSMLVLSGSLPPGCPQDFYRTLAADAAEEGCRVILDADGARLRLGLEARPFLIKPNRYELELLMGRELPQKEAILQAAMDLIARGVRIVVVSMGAEGALMTDGKVAYHAPGLKVEVRSTVAAGDSMIAGLAAGLNRNLELDQVFSMGIAAATARCMTPPEAVISAKDCRELAQQIEMEKLF